MSGRESSFSPEALIASARAQAGLEDFGGEGFRDALARFCEALEGEAELNGLGRQVARGQLQRLLVNRLGIEEVYRRHPEIDEQVPEPVFMIGLPRTGTTALAALLSRDPEYRSLLAWEAGRPVPPPESATRTTDPRIAATQAGIDALHTMRPEIRAMYDASATGSTECQDLLGMEFRTQHFCGQYWIPSYAAWQQDCDMDAAYGYHRRTLKLLQWRSPPARWHLHSPVHMLSLDGLLRAYPDARFLMTHRDPSKVLGSVCSLVSAMISLASDRRDPEGVGAAQMDTWSEALARAIRFRERVGEDRFADVPFADLVEDPVAAVERAYRRLGLPFSEGARAGMADWASANPRGRHGVHRYRLEDFGLDVRKVRERFAFYTDRFDLTLED